MSRIIEAKAVISGEDRGVGKMLDGLARRFREVGKGAKVHADVSKLGREIDGLNKGLRDIERFRGTQATFAQARTAYRGAQSEVQRISRDLDAARKAAQAFDGIRSFTKGGAIAQEMATARKAVSDLERQFISAQRSVKASASSFEAQAAALKSVRAELSGSGLNVGKLVAEQNRLKQAVDQTTSAIQRQERATHAESRLASGMSASGRAQYGRIAQSRFLIEGMSAAGRAGSGKPAGTMAGGAPDTAHSGALDAAAGLGAGALLKSSYGKARDGWLEMDEASRRQKVILSLSDDQQRPLNTQALKIGQDTRFSNPDVVKAQTRIGSSLSDHLKDPKVISAITESSKNYALAMGTTMDQGSEAILSRMLGRRMDMSSPEAAAASAKHASNRLVQFAKSSGADHNDVINYSKVASGPAQVGGYSEEYSDALAAQLRRLGYDGSMAGNFVRAAATRLAVPTSKGLAALAANGINHSDYVASGKELSAQNLDSALKLKFGKSLNDGQKARIHELMQDEEVVGNRDEFVPRASAIIQETLAKRNKKGKINAQDAERIAKSVNEYLSAAAGATDIQRLTTDVIAKGLTPGLSKYLFGQEHGGRAQSLDAKTLDRDVESFKKTPDNRAQKVGEDINAGAYGANQRMTGSIETFWMRLGQVNDKPLTAFYDTMGNIVDKISGLPDQILAVGTAATAAAGALLTIKGVASGAAMLGVPGAAAVAGAVPLIGVTAGTAASAAFAGYATTQVMPKVAAEQGATAIDPATGGMLEAPGQFSGPARPFVQDWWRSTMPTWLGGDPSGQKAALSNTLDKAAAASATAANGGKPVEATVKPDQITAKIDTLPPVTGEAKVDVESKLNVIVTLNEPMLQAKIDSAAGKAVAKIPLSSSGARPGAVSMPGAAATPGTAK